MGFGPFPAPGTLPDGTVVIENFGDPILIAADFPTSLEVLAGRSWLVGASVTDNDVTKTNTGQSFVSGQVIAWSGSNWVVTSGSAGGGSLTSVGADSPNSTLDITNSPLTGAGGTLHFDLPVTAVTPGSYTSSNITVDAYGRVTLAANGSGGAGDVTGPVSAGLHYITSYGNINGKELEAISELFVGADGTLSTANGATPTGISLTAGSSTGGNGDGGNIALNPGAANGSGAEGFVSINSQLTGWSWLPTPQAAATYSLTSADIGYLIVNTGVSTVYTLPAIAALADGARFRITNQAATSFTIVLGGGGGLIGTSTVRVNATVEIVYTEANTSFDIQFVSNSNFISPGTNIYAVDSTIGMPPSSLVPLTIITGDGATPRDINIAAGSQTGVGPAADVHVAAGSGGASGGYIYLDSQVSINKSGSGTGPGGLVIINAPISLIGTGAYIELTTDNAGAPTYINVNNISNAANSTAKISVGCTGGDALIALGNVANALFYVGVDKSDSNKFKIGDGGVVGTTTALTIIPTTHEIQLGGNNLTFSNGYATISTAAGVGAIPAGPITIYTGAAGAGSVAGADLSFSAGQAGAAGGAGGYTSIYSGQGIANGTSGGILSLVSGAAGSTGAGKGGAILIQVGSSGSTGDGESITIAAGLGNGGGADGNINLDVGTGQVLINGVPISDGSGITYAAPTINTTLTANSGWYINNVGSINLTLPAVIAAGESITIQNNGAGGFVLLAGTGQVVTFNSYVSSGVAGATLTSTTQGDSVTLICTVANTSFYVVSSCGNITTN